MSKKKENKARTTIKIKDEKLDYEVQLKKKRNYWWLLLLLLMVPLFINLNKDITIKVVDNKEKPVEGAKVDFEFTSFYFFKKGKFFLTDTISGKRSDKTDNDGLCKFEDCGYSIYGMIFKCFHKAVLTVSSDCHKSAGGHPLYHYLYGTLTVLIERDMTDLTVFVIDKDDKEPISEAMVYFHYEFEGTIVEDSLMTDAAGRIFLKKLEKCGTIDYLKGSCYGYHDDLRENIKVKDALRNVENLTLILEPIKESINFYVVNCNSRQPLSNANAIITVNNAQRSKTYSVKTNTDGRGRAVYQGFHILSEISIVASKSGFKDGTFGKKYTVEQFIALPDSLRTICLEPEPQTIEFINKDVYINEGIEGVTNAIKITSTTRTENHVEISGKKGVFYLKVLEGDEVYIESEINPDYLPVQNNFTTIQNKNEIWMTPRDTILYFCVFDEDDKSPVVNHTDLHATYCYKNILGCIDTIFSMNLSKSCRIEATLFIPYNIDFITKAKGYSNNEQIKNIPVKTLMNDDALLQLPMRKECQGDTYSKENDIYTINEYDLSGYNKIILFEYNTYAKPDTIIIYDSPKGLHSQSNIIFRYGLDSNGKKDTLLNLQSKKITIEVFGISEKWSYKISCPP